MVSDRDRNYLQHIVDAIELAERFSRGLSFDDFSKDEMALAATIRQIEVIGEASYKLSEKFQEDHPEIPWHAMRGMRNHLIHGYFDVDIQLVWQTTKRSFLN